MVRCVGDGGSQPVSVHRHSAGPEVMAVAVTADSGGGAGELGDQVTVVRATALATMRR